MKIIFDENEAIKNGLKKAIVLSTIRFLIIEQPIFYGGFAATRIGREKIKETLPFMPFSSVSKYIRQLISAGVLFQTDDFLIGITGEFRECDFNRVAFRFLIKRASE